MLGPFSPWKEATGSGLECTAAGVFSMAQGSAPSSQPWPSVRDFWIVRAQRTEASPS